MLVLKRGDQDSAQVLAAPVSRDQMIEFDANNQERIAIKLAGAPRIGHIYGSYDDASATPCVQLLTNTKATTSNSASCNASGTPASGWYQSGRVLQHSSNCGNETLSCGAAPKSGWYVQKKTQRVLAKSEKCGWMRETPLCKSGALATGWHIGERLIARDDECSYKQMECGSTGTKQEGWYVFERSSPQLLIASPCHFNREISYLAP